VIVARAADRAFATDELHAPALPYLFRLSQQNSADLAGAADVCSATGGEIELGNIDEAQLVFLNRGYLAQLQISGFVWGDKANAHRPVFEHDLIGQPLGRDDLFGS